MSLRFVPSSNYSSKTTPPPSAPSAPGLPDLLRSSQTQPSPTGPAPTTSTHTLEARLTSWRTQQDALKMETLRRTYGIAEPIRRGMELKIVEAGEWRPACLGKGANVHADILRGTDAGIEGWEDVFTDKVLGSEGAGVVGGFHAEMEGRLRMGALGPI
ncbi:MAG: hypothetical protein M1814_000710 [Vezdaea aestivalis]|nr:MAG: hypothetical protein M1814_000710 [Vezdaea aestivalis]